MSRYSSRGTEWNAIAARVKEQYDVCQYQFGGCTVDRDLTVDHIIPKEKGGTDDEWNLTVACRTCNGRKKNNVLTRVTWIDREWMKA